MATVWFTYAWADNAHGDVDFIIQELINSGIEVKIDRWNIQSGKRLWEQISNFIQNTSECDAWVMYATSNSLGSEPCREEFAYALDRALNTRGNAFPVIGLFPSRVDNTLIPAGIKTRLYVSTNDPDWRERVKSAAENRAPVITRPEILPYFVGILSPNINDAGKTIIELRPRASTWSPFFVAVPVNEKSMIELGIIHGSSGRRPQGGVLLMSGEAVSDCGKWLIKYAQNEATPTQSYFIFCKSLPSMMIFGVYNGQPQYMLDQAAMLRSPLMHI